MVHPLPSIQGRTAARSPSPSAPSASCSRALTLPARPGCSTDALEGNLNGLATMHYTRGPAGAPLRPLPRRLGYDADEDTWEDSAGLPQGMVAAYGQDTDETD